MTKKQKNYRKDFNIEHYVTFYYTLIFNIKKIPVPKKSCINWS